MKISYTFATGEKAEVDVSEEIGTVIVDTRRDEHAGNERERYHRAFSIDSMVYENQNYFDAGGNPEDGILREELRKELRDALDQLTEAQQRRFLLYASNVPIAEIARREGASFNSVKESVKGAQKKLRKILKNF